MSEIVCKKVGDPAEIEECFAIRRKIFVEEQSLFQENDRDEHDAHAVHIAACCNSRIVGTVRVYADADGIWWGGRLAVLKPFRGRAGKLLVQAAVEYVKSQQAQCFRAYVQLDNVNFFKSIGWMPVSDVCQYHGRPHQLMEAYLEKSFAIPS